MHLRLPFFIFFVWDKRSIFLAPAVQYTMKNRIYTTVGAVTALSVAERALGFLYRITLSRLIGAEGVGLYQVSLTLFSLFLTIGTGGIPITVSRMIAKSKAENNPKGEQHAVSAGIFLCLVLSLPVCVIFWLLGDKMPFLFSDQRCLKIFKILLLGLCFSCVYAVIRGHFWGNKQLLLSSVLEISEETVMVIVGVLLLKNVHSPAMGAERAAWAVVLSYLFSFTASLVCFFIKKGKLSNPKKSIKPLFNATLPITSVRASGSFINSAIAVLLPMMLVKTGVSKSEALQLFGVVSGMALPILFIPSTVIGSLSLVLVPQLAEDFYRKRTQRLRENITRGLRAALLVACFLIPFFYTLGEDIGKIAYSNLLAGQIIVKSSPLLLPMSLSMICASILNSMGYEKQTFLFYFIGAAAMLLSILFLPSFCGVYAYIIGFGLSHILNAVCSLIFLQKECAIFQKSSHHVRVEPILLVLLSVLPLSIFGQFCNSIFKCYFGQLLAFTLSGTILFCATFLLYLLFGIIRPTALFSLLSRTRKGIKS